jgi:DNA-binding NtrC family response regulator
MFSYCVHVATILLVGDDGSTRKVARGALERSGYRVLEAANGKEALWLSETHAGRIDLLLGQTTHHHQGISLAEQIMNRRPGLKVLPVTPRGSVPPPSPRSLIPSDSWNVTRNFRSDRLLRAVREALDGLPHGE